MAAVTGFPPYFTACRVSIIFLNDFPVYSTTWLHIHRNSHVKIIQSQTANPKGQTVARQYLHCITCSLL